MEKQTLYAFQYIDGTIDYSFGKIRNQAKKEIVNILMEEMEIEREWAFEACAKETQLDIVISLLEQNGFSNSKTYKI